MTTAGLPRIVPLGDAAVLVVLGETIDEAVNARVHLLAAAVRRLADEEAGYGAPVPAYASLLVPVDPHAPGTGAAAERLARLVSTVDRRGPPPVGDEPPLELPTRYGDRDGPDLDDVAALHGLAPAAVVEAHASVDYRVHFLGFSPGFAYLARVPAAIATPRLASPRERVPAGSVAIADEQTGVYPVDSPGGWRILGRTDVAVWRPRDRPPALLEPGRRVRFIPVGD